MKKIILIVYLTLAYCYLFSQDSITKHSSWSITLNVNTIYPTTKQFTEKSEYINPSFGYYWDITPKWSINPQIIINYEKIILETPKSSFSIVSGIGYIHNSYNATYKGWYIMDFPPYGGEGTFNVKFRENYIEMNLGLAYNLKFNKHFIWENKFVFVPDIFIKGDPPMADHEYNLNCNHYYLYYQTGFRFHLFNDFYYVPTISLPIIELCKKNNNHYGNIIIGFTLTYTKKEK